jgi:hypothetical protein
MIKLTAATLLTLISAVTISLVSSSVALAQEVSPSTPAAASSSNVEKAAQPQVVKQVAKKGANLAATSSSKTSDATSPKVAARADRLDLETTMVTGNRELPKVLYIVPWKRAELGDLPAQPFNTLLDEMLQPVDREVFKREVKYFQAVNSGSAATKAAPGSAPSPTTVGP